MMDETNGSVSIVGASSALRIAPVGVLLALVVAACGGGWEEGAPCGEGTTVSGGECVPIDDLCGEGTVRTGDPDGRCVAVDTFCADGTVFDRSTLACISASEVSCGPGTYEAMPGLCLPGRPGDCPPDFLPGDEPGSCLPINFCGPGTTWDGDKRQCVPTDGSCPGAQVRHPDTAQCVEFTACGEGTERDADTALCVPTDEVCPTGEAWSASRGTCVSVSEVCGEGTRWDGTWCRPEASWCGVGVTWDADLERCVGGQVRCGDGTILTGEGDTCVVASEACGVGTELGDDDRCGLSSDTCGAGTVRDDDGSRCIASAAACGPRTTWNDASESCGPAAETCGPGTTWHEFANGCLPDEEPGSRCGANTLWDPGTLTCIPDPALCDGGSVVGADGRCVVPDTVCAEGTVWDPDLRTCSPGESVCAAGTAWDAVMHQCVPTGDVCGDGTTWNPESRRCELLGLSCGTGTVFHADSGECRVGSTACGPGTVQGLDGRCEPAATACGFGTAWDSDAGVCAVQASACFEGTQFDPDVGGCVPSPDVCGPGTTFVPEEQRCFRGALIFGDCEDPTPLDNVREDTILVRDNCYLVTAERDVASGAMLTIEPGVTILFAAGASFTVTGTGVLRALGTDAAPVRLAGTTDVPGWWRGLRIAQTSSPLNLLQHVIVEHAGDQPWVSGSEESRAGIYFVSNGANARAAFHHVTSRNNLGYGMSVQSAIGPSICVTAGYITFDGFSDNTFTGNTGPPLRIFNDIAGVVDATSSFVGNGVDRIDIYGANCRDIISTQVLSNVGIPYRSSGRFLVTSGAQLTLEPGVEIQFNRDTGMDVRGAFVARGTEAEPVVLTSVEGTPGSWDGVRVTGYTGPASYLEHTQIRNAGGNAWVGDVAAGLTVSSGLGAVTTRLRGVTVRDTLGTGLFIHGIAVTLDAFEDNVFTANSDYPVIVSSRQATRLDEGSSYAGNGHDVVRIESVGAGSSAGMLNTDGTIRGLEVPWEVAEPLRVRDGATVVIEAGVNMGFALNTWFRVGDGASPGYIQIMGTPEEPVVMEGVVAVPGWWRGFFMGNSLNPLNEINHLTVRHGGSEQWSAQQPPANMHLTGTNGSSRLAMQGVRLEDGLGAGLYVTNTVDILSCEDISFSNVGPSVIGDVAWFEAACGPIEPDD